MWDGVHLVVRVYKPHKLFYSCLKQCNTWTRCTFVRRVCSWAQISASLVVCFHWFNTGVLKGSGASERRQKQKSEWQVEPRWSVCRSCRSCCLFHFSPHCKSRLLRFTVYCTTNIYCKCCSWLVLMHAAVLTCPAPSCQTSTVMSCIAIVRHNIFSKSFMTECKVMAGAADRNHFLFSWVSQDWCLPTVCSETRRSAR